jgi:nicotinate phosphoribosyltransferase
MTTSADAPYLDCAYKLQAYAGRARRKHSEGKATWPGAKQVYRHTGADGRIAYDVLTLADDPQEGEALIQPVMQAGRRLAPPAPLAKLRQRAAAELAHLPEHLRKLKEGPPVPVRVSQALRDLAKAVDERTG